MSSVQKILDELHHSRIQLDNDKKSGEKARVDYVEFDNKIKTLRDKHESCSQKLTEVYKSIAVRTIDVNLYSRKLEIVKFKIEELKDKIDCHLHQLKALHEEYSGISEWLLQNSIKFANLWNCTERGYEQRRIHQQNTMISLKAKKVQLLNDLDEFLAMQKKIDVLTSELQGLEDKYQKHEIVMNSKEKDLYEEMDRADGALVSLCKKKEKICEQRSGELDRLLELIDTKKNKIAKLEIRVAKAQSVVDGQKRQPQPTQQQSYWPTSKKVDDGIRMDMTMTNTSRIYQPIKPTPTVQTGYTFRVVPNSGGNAFSESPYKDERFPEDMTQNTQKSNPKGARIFHFKKKPAISNPTNRTENDFVSGRSIYQKKYVP